MSAQEAHAAVASISLDAQIGRRVHQLLWDRQMTQSAFGDLIGMDQSSVAKRFRGKLGWSAAQVKDAADVLNTSVAYLYGESGDSGPLGPNSPTADYKPATSVVSSLADFRARKAA